MGLTGEDEEDSLGGGGGSANICCSRFVLYFLNDLEIHALGSIK